MLWDPRRSVPTLLSQTFCPTFLSQYHIVPLLRRSVPEIKLVIGAVSPRYNSKVHDPPISGCKRKRLVYST